MSAQTALYDVGVIGGGPSGSTLARILARGGKRVYLIDRGMPGEKAVCGGFLGPEMGALFDDQGIGQEFRGLAKNPIGSVAISGPGTGLFESRFKSPGSAVSRPVFDRWLFELASKAGAAVSPWTRVERMRREGGVWRLSLARADGGYSVRCRYLVQAYGRRSQPSQDVFFACRMVYERAQLKEDQVLLHFVKKGHVGLNPQAGGRTTMCLYVHSDYLKSCAGNLDRMMQRLFLENAHLRRCLEDAVRVDEWQSCQAEPDGRREFWQDGVFRVGDAVTMVNPIVGGGIPVAIGSAAILAGRLIEAAVRGVSEEAAAADYRRLWETAFLRRVRFARLLGGLERSRPAARGVFGLFRHLPGTLSPVVSLSRSL